MPLSSDWSWYSKVGLGRGCGGKSTGRYTVEYNMAACQQGGRHLSLYSQPPSHRANSDYPTSHWTHEVHDKPSRIAQATKTSVLGCSALRQYPTPDDGWKAERASPPPRIDSGQRQNDDAHAAHKASRSHPHESLFFSSAESADPGKPSLPPGTSIGPTTSHPPGRPPFNRLPRPVTDHDAQHAAVSFLFSPTSAQASLASGSCHCIGTRLVNATQRGGPSQQAGSEYVCKRCCSLLLLDTLPDHE